MLILAILAVAVVACGSTAPDVVLLNGRVFTADPERPWAEALAIRRERIVAVGTTDEIRALADEGTQQRDLGGRVTIPGFNDAHVMDPGGGVADLRAFGQRAATLGVTSMQWFVPNRTVIELRVALVEANLPQRLRLFRMPRPGPNGETIDSRQHLPPQPTLRIDIRGMGFRLAAADEARIRQAVGWAFGTEDLLALEPLDAQAQTIYIDATDETGVPDVWQRKRPRLEQASTDAIARIPDLVERGFVVVQRPRDSAPLASFARAGVTLALGSDTGVDVFSVLAWATSPERGAERLTMDAAVRAFTRAAAVAEFSDRDKGFFAPGARADIAVLSHDIFDGAPFEPANVRSVLTLIGGQVVHDVP
ncbi:MAG: amidohydrolase family protein [Acidobacteria bacterium]|nr:amidohydrolase family protein [Acidobacteriota bacterium]